MGLYMGHGNTARVYYVTTFIVPSIMMVHKRTQLAQDPIPLYKANSRTITDFSHAGSDSHQSMGTHMCFFHF